jgi:hypothetical protein
MASEKTTTSTRSDAKITDGDREPTQRGGADGKSKALSSRACDNGRVRKQSSADELGRRAWEATYKNRQKNRRD